MATSELRISVETCVQAQGGSRGKLLRKWLSPRRGLRQRIVVDISAAQYMMTQCYRRLLPLSTRPMFTRRGRFLLPVAVKDALQETLEQEGSEMVCEVCRREGGKHWGNCPKAK